MSGFGSPPYCITFCLCAFKPFITQNEDFYFCQVNSTNLQILRAFPFINQMDELNWTGTINMQGMVEDTIF